MRRPRAEIINEFMTDAREGRQPLALFHNMNSPTVVEVLGAIGHRVIIFDQEHTSMNHETLTSLIRAAELNDMMVIVRVPRANQEAALKALDAGAHGIWVQHLESAAQVRAFADSMYFPPDGSRGYCAFPRVNNNGVGMPLDFIKYSNEQPILIVGLNNEEILEELEDILRIPNIPFFQVNQADIIVRAGYGEYDDFMQMHEISKGINESIRAAGKLTMGLFFSPDFSDMKATREYFGAEAADVWFTSDLGCMVSGVRQMNKVVEVLVQDRAAGSMEAADALNEGSEDGDGAAIDVPRTC